ncbi:hypothetical protein H310_13591 [Aphanomyces invadans]|uniref:Uncharacterized protein n=1 Tax=Aphanomyces invadans TaxID=157072 RepID=A0A024TDJ1_9STRA|nr:hypothetical protein H310_13591 [Aphanomyces invadans]ETV92069.1 hypothetical protein H310_13591 [Aphanomyces invadans]|eukprot:XP_008879366.1 hypothetical protein H310_13591 [Aphanomyces invadans]
MAKPVKRRQFTLDKDVMLLTQVSSQQPFLALCGSIMDVRDSVDKNLASLDEFDRPNFEGKKVQARFTLLTRDHANSTAASARASGVVEDVNETTILLDELASKMKVQTMKTSDVQVLINVLWRLKRKFGEVTRQATDRQRRL